MSYCMKCGSRMPDEAIYCSVCGAEMNNPATLAIIPDREMQTQDDQLLEPFQKSLIERRREILETEKLVRYFSQKKYLFDEYDGKCGDLLRLKKGVSKIHIMLGSICLGIGFLILLVTVIIWSTLRFEIAYTTLSQGGPLFFVGGIFLVFGVIEYVMHLSKQLKLKNEAHALENRLRAIGGELNDYYKGYNACQVGFEYTNPAVLQKIGYVLRMGRADSIKDALDILIEDARKTNMPEFERQKELMEILSPKGSDASALYNAVIFLHYV